MSTYDAYNLSLRDSTEFTVPTGGSGGDSQFSTYNLKIRNTAGSAASAASIAVPFVVDTEFVNKYAEILGISADEILNQLGGFVPQIGTTQLVFANGSYSEFKVIAINGVTTLTFGDGQNISVDYISENVEEIRADAFYKITGDAVIDFRAVSNV